MSVRPDCDLLPKHLSFCSLTDMKDFGDDSLHDRMHCYIELAWICSTGLGILLFLVQVSLSLYVNLTNNLINCIQRDPHYIPRFKTQTGHGMFHKNLVLNN